MASKLHATVSMHCHQWFRVLPTKLINARPTEWRNTFGHMPATHLVSRHCNPPACQLRNKASRHCGTKHLKEPVFFHNLRVSLKGSKPCHIWFRLLTAISFQRISAHLCLWPFSWSDSNSLNGDKGRTAVQGGNFSTHRPTSNMQKRKVVKVSP